MSNDIKIVTTHSNAAPAIVDNEVHPIYLEIFKACLEEDDQYVKRSYEYKEIKNGIDSFSGLERIAREICFPEGDLFSWDLSAQTDFGAYYGNTLYLYHLNGAFVAFVVSYPEYCDDESDGYMETLSPILTADEAERFCAEVIDRDIESLKSKIEDAKSGLQALTKSIQDIRDAASAAIQITAAEDGAKVISGEFKVIEQGDGA